MEHFSQYVMWIKKLNIFVLYPISHYIPKQILKRNGTSESGADLPNNNIVSNDAMKRQEVQLDV